MFWDIELSISNQSVKCNLLIINNPLEEYIVLGLGYWGWQIDIELLIPLRVLPNILMHLCAMHSVLDSAFVLLELCWWFEVHLAVWVHFAEYLDVFEHDSFDYFDLDD
jgi:hypothetical protein